MAIWGPVQMSCLCRASLFSVELIFGGAYYWKEFCISKWVGLDNKNSLKHYKNSLKQLAVTVHGLIFRRAYYWKDFCVWDLGGVFSGGLIFYLFIFFWGGGLIIGILRYVFWLDCVPVGKIVMWLQKILILAPLWHNVRITVVLLPCYTQI